MRIAEIIDQLCSHQISKSDAIEKLRDIVEEQRCCAGFDYFVNEVGETVSEECYLKLYSYSYTKNKSKIKKGDRVKVIIEEC
jgi:hypothetical protein